MIVVDPSICDWHSNAPQDSKWFLMWIHHTTYICNGQLHLVSSCHSFPFIEFQSILCPKKNHTSYQVGGASSEKVLTVKSIFRWPMILQMQNKGQSFSIKPVLTSKQNNCAMHSYYSLQMCPQSRHPAAKQTNKPAQVLLCYLHCVCLIHNTKQRWT